MELKLLDRSVTPHSGYGAGAGEVIREEYACPCGEGLVIYEKDAIPGFRDSGTSCMCSACNKKYDFERGFATEK